VANLYSVIAMGVEFNDSRVAFDRPDKLGLFLRAISSGLILPALAFFGACILYHVERWKGRSA